MTNTLTNNKNHLTIEEWFNEKNQGNINNQEIQRFKSNVLAIKNQLGLPANKTTLEACYQATLLQLPLEKNFGYCWVVPFNRKYKDEQGNWKQVKEAQFQMGYKGYIQLAMRSQQYKLISTSDVRLGELKKIDRLKGIKFNWIQNELERLKAPIIGYVAYFKMKNGQEKTLYMSKEEVENHFNTYSETYKKNKRFIVSSFEAMALKTVLTQLLRKWGIMSVDMQTAYESDQAVILEDEKIMKNGKYSKYMWCDFCGCKLEKIRSNNGRCIAKIIGKDEMKICSFCNKLEINIRIYGNTLSFLNQWYYVQPPMAKFSIDNKGYYNIIVKNAK